MILPHGSSPPATTAVPFEQAQALASTIPSAELLESTADSHLIWFGPDWPALCTRITTLLTAPLPTTNGREQP